MKKIKDRIFLGMITGMLANIPGQILNISEHKLKITDIPYSQVATKLYITKKDSKTLAGHILSVIINLLNAGFAGVATTYVLSATGKDKAITKSLGVWTLLWILVGGILSKVVLKAETKKSKTPFLGLFDHLLMGTINGLLITKLGDDSLFPDKDISKKEKIPLMYTGTSENME